MRQLFSFIIFNLFVTFNSFACIPKAVVETFKDNDKLLMAFHQSKMDSVKRISTEMLGRIKGEKFKDTFYQDWLNTIEKELRLMSESNNETSRRENNSHFHAYSVAMVKLLKTLHHGHEKDLKKSQLDQFSVYHCSCPGVKKSWIQNQKNLVKVTNPYEPRMPHCGKVFENVAKIEIVDNKLKL